MWLDKLWEYKESISRPPVPDEAVAKVKDDIEYSNHLVKVHNVMNVLDLPNNQEEAFRKSLTKQDNKTLEELAKKSKKDIIIFLTIENNQKIELDSKNLNIENQKNEEKLSKIDSKSDEKEIKQNQDIQKNNQKEIKLNQDIQKIKSVFTPQILEKNSEIATEFKNLDKEWNDKQEILKNILNILKDPKILKSITDQLWWADKNNPQYLEFKNALLWVDTSFETYFKDLEGINSWASINTNEIVKWIKKDSWWMIDIDLNSHMPISKMSLIWSSYSFDEEIDKKALAEVMWKCEKELMEVQNSFAVLKGLYKPFDGLLMSARENWWKPNLKDKLNEAVSGFSKGLFDELDDVYKNMNIKPDIQIKESDIASFENINSADELRLKITNVKDKLEKIKTHIQEVQTWILDKSQTEVKELLSKNSEAKEKQLEVLNFMRSSGFDLIPKEISDKLIREVQGETLNIPWLDLNIKNIDLKMGNFGEDTIHKWEWLNIHSKTNMVKFMNKLISWDINNPLAVESIANWKTTVDSSSMQNQFLEAGVVDSLWWREWKITENLTKASVEKTA